MHRLFGKGARAPEMAEASGSQVSPVMDLDDFNREANELERQCGEVQGTIREMVRLQRELEQAPTESDATAISRVIDAKASQVMRQASVTNVGLRSMATRNNTLPPNDPTARMRANTHSKLVNRLMTILNEYQQANRIHRDTMRGRFARNKSYATDEDVANAVNQQPDHLYSAEILRSTRGERSAVALRAAREQQREVNRIEQEVEGQMVDSIEQNVYRAEIAMETGGGQLDRAVRSARAARKKRIIIFCLIVLAIIVAVAVAVPVAIPKKSSGSGSVVVIVTTTTTTNNQ
ncbi:t-SNARE [Syncephalis fuscata]|nr:t-SNARE [Syncephalis fuscata]